MEGSTEEFEPLFDYSRIQPVDFAYIDDDSLDSSPIFVPKRKRDHSPAEKKEEVNSCKVGNIEDDDWLLPPPKKPAAAKEFEGDSTIQELRLKKEELASFAQSAQDVLQAVEESVKLELSNSVQLQLLEEAEAEKPPATHDKREKIVVSVQDKDGAKQFRMYMDDKFERLFKMYAEKVKANLGSLVFSFDGDKVSPTETPQSLGMENDDIIEVRIKSK